MKESNRLKVREKWVSQRMTQLVKKPSKLRPFEGYGCGRVGRLELLVHWNGYANADDECLPEDRVCQSCRELPGDGGRRKDRDCVC